jgi:asparagine synthetase B (glutamine-hydrolysing)
MKYFITLTTTPNGALTKVDRAASAAGLEIRMPFLDHRLADFSWALPPHMKLRGPTNKWLLRQVLYRYVPPAILDRPKMGFNVPIGLWLRGPLRDWAEALLDQTRPSPCRTSRSTSARTCVRPNDFETPSRRSMGVDGSFCVLPRAAMKHPCFRNASYYEAAGI